MMKALIPKIIHYCWFGGKPLPKSAQRCIASWKKYCPDYEIKEWNETNVNINSVDYMREAYEEKVWGFVPDVARLQIIYENGGIYLDTDVEIVRSFDSLLTHSAFMGIETTGTFDKRHVALGLGFGAERGNAIIADMLNDYKNRHFRTIDGNLDRTPSPQIQTLLLSQKGFNGKDELQIVGGATIYPSEYFCPIVYKTGELNLTENTYSIHHFDGSWLTELQKEKAQIRRALYKKYGKFAVLIWPFSIIKCEVKYAGVCKTILKMFQRLFKIFRR